eukprot:GHVU01201746.1.p1 GENE.GHVU01201746.1~~GHVU01201746.1.p1  ORF type:complete len:281 (+),score=13.46 GHVU01201746.1:44-844(+)
MTYDSCSGSVRLYRAPYPVHALACDDPVIVNCLTYSLTDPLLTPSLRPCGSHSVCDCIRLSHLHIHLVMYSLSYFFLFSPCNTPIPCQVAFLAKPIHEPVTRQEQHYTQAQESRRKDVERTFGILQSRFHFLRIPCRWWYKRDVLKAVKTCVILHNMHCVDGTLYEVQDQLPPVNVGSIIADGDSPAAPPHRHPVPGQEAADSGDSTDGEQALTGDQVPAATSAGAPEVGESAFDRQVARVRDAFDPARHGCLRRDLMAHLWHRRR